MILPSQTRVGAFLSSDKTITKGLEKENLRANSFAEISDKSYPKSLGSHHFNNYVTLDYSEPHLELITPTFENNDDLYSFLSQLHFYVQQNLDGDYLWNYSMPPIFKEDVITLPKAGVTNKSKLAYLYRLGLRNRYGDKMQSTAGIHFNISFSETYLKNLAEEKNQFYLGVARNFLRLFPIALRLTGCSPVTHCSFLKGRDLHVEQIGENNCYLPKATSLRVSRLGYYSEEQEKNFIDFNSLDGYLDIMREYINKPNKKFSNIPSSAPDYQQVNTGTIQMESELYNHIRPKAKQPNLRQFIQLESSGIDYLEIRSIDLNPFSDIGVSANDLLFWEAFTFYCTICESPEINAIEAEIIKENIRRASERGQDCNLITSYEDAKSEASIKTITNEFLNRLEQVLNKSQINENFDEMIVELKRRNEKPLSERVIEEILACDGIINFVKTKSLPIEIEINSELQELFMQESLESLKKFDDHLSKDKIGFDEFLKNFRGETK